MSDFLNLEGKNIAVMGVANRRSIAAAVAAVLREAGANVIYIFKDQELLDKNRKLIGEDAPAVVCDVTDDNQIAALDSAVGQYAPVLDGLVHSIAYAPYSNGMQPFHDIPKADFLQAMDISCFSLMNVCRQLKSRLSPEASIVTMSISTTKMASESYGYMGPIKAALDASVVFLAKSLSSKVSPRIRVNAVGASPLKTSASAGIPGYVDAYLFAEKATLRHEALQTPEAANVVAFLLSPRASGITAQTVIVDCGMSCNYFDDALIHPEA